MDGQQRLNTIKEFLNNEFRLSSLTVLWPLNGMSYSACPPRIKRGLDRAVITSVILLLESDTEIEGKGVTQPDIRRFIFDRLNTGGTKLNAQELRNAIYPGSFNDMIIETTRDTCLNEEITAEASKILGYNMNNMRAREINEIFKRVGIKDFCSSVGRNTTMIEFFGAATADISHGKFLGQIEEFYENRNDVAHSIGSVRGTGPIQVSRYLDFFNCTAQVFAAELNSLLQTE